MTSGPHLDPAVELADHPAFGQEQARRALALVLVRYLFPSVTSDRAEALARWIYSNERAAP